MAAMLLGESECPMFHLQALDKKQRHLETGGKVLKTEEKKIDFQMPLFFSFKLIKSTQKLIYDDMSTNNNSYQLGWELQSCHI